MNLILLDEQERRSRYRFSNGSYAWQLQDLIDKNINPNYSFGIFCKVVVLDNILYAKWATAKFIRGTISISEPSDHMFNFNSASSWGWQYSDGFVHYSDDYIDSMKRIPEKTKWYVSSFASEDLPSLKKLDCIQAHFNVFSDPSKIKENEELKDWWMNHPQEC